MRATFLGCFITTTLEIIVIVKRFVSPIIPDEPSGLLEPPNNLLSMLQAIVTIFYMGLIANLVRLQLMAIDLQEKEKFYQPDRFTFKDGR